MRRDATKLDERASSDTDQGDDSASPKDLPKDLFKKSKKLHSDAMTLGTAHERITIVAR